MDDQSESESAGEAARADLIEAEAWQDLFAAAPPALAAQLGLAAREVGGATLLLAPRLPVTLFNRAIALGVRRPATEEDVEALRAAYAAAGVRDYWVHLGAARPAALRGWLTARGFTTAPRPTWAKVVRSPAAPPQIETALAVREVGAPEGAALGQVLAAAHGMPPLMAPWIAALAGRPRWRAYLAFAGDEPVAGGLLFQEGRDGWLGLGGTLPAHRRRGGQGAILARRIRDAGAARCDLVTTETGEPVAGEPNPSLANMYRCGFRRVCARENLAAPPPLGAR